MSALKNTSNMIDKLTKGLSSLGGSSGSSGKKVGSLEDTITNLGDESVATREKMDSLESGLGRLGTSLKSLDAAMTKYYFAWEDTAKVQMRGSRLLGQSKQVIVETKESLMLASQSYSRLTGQSIDESTRVMKGIMEGMIDARHLTDEIDWKNPGREAKQYLSTVAGAQKIANIGAAEMADLQKMLFTQFQSSIEGASGTIDDMAQATIKYGADGTAVIQGIASHMDTIMALDYTQREKQLEKIIRTTAIQERAMVDFGKYVDRIRPKEGTDLLQSAYEISAYSGQDSLEVYKNMVASKGGDIDATIAYMESILASADRMVSMATGGQSLEELQQKGIQGTLTREDMLSYTQAQETVLQTIGKTVGMDTASVGALRGEIDRLTKMREDGIINLNDTPDSNVKKTTWAAGGGAIGNDLASSLDTQSEREMSSQANISKQITTLNNEFGDLASTVSIARTALDHLIPALNALSGVANFIGGAFSTIKGLATSMTPAKMIGGAVAIPLLGKAGKWAYDKMTGADDDISGTDQASNADRELESLKKEKEKGKGFFSKIRDIIMGSGNDIPTDTLSDKFRANQKTVDETLESLDNMGTAMMDKEQSASKKHRLLIEGIDQAGRGGESVYRHGISPITMGDIDTGNKKAHAMATANDGLDPGVSSAKAKGLAHDLQSHLMDHGYIADIGWLNQKAAEAIRSGNPVDLSDLVRSPKVYKMIGYDNVEPADLPSLASTPRDPSPETLERYANPQPDKTRAVLTPLNNSMPAMDADRSLPEVHQDRADRINERGQSGNLESLVGSNLLTVVDLLSGIKDALERRSAAI